MQTLNVAGHLDALEAIRQYAKTAAQLAGLDPKATTRLCLAVDEIATNIILHGYEEAGRQGEVQLKAVIEVQQLTLTMEDSAIAYDPRQAPAPDLTLPPELRPIGGLGVYLAIKSVDQFHYERRGERNHNIFIMKKAGT